MQSKATTPEQYIAELPDDRKEVIKKLRNTILDNLPDGFEEVMSYGMLGYVVPHSLYPNGYHCDPKLPLPFISLASQKAHIGFYHMGIYANKELMDWLTKEYTKTDIKVKLNMGKSCIRFKKEAHIPYKLLGDLVSKVTPKEWIATYEAAFKK
ncbi:DUF1801 domain-containing protein [Pseudofulvibacter geojedonensis]|uniref:DUF1801 domain-containing protein n=1 Tax=Pseudofulvibacter geojedonensis TaxID=1123758 RepID=A0ABW3I394_9FLAO